MVPSRDADVHEKARAEFKVRKKWGSDGVMGSDLAEVGGILAYNELFSADGDIYTISRG